MQNLYELGMDFLNKAFDDSFSNIEFFFLAYAAALAVFWLRKKHNLKSFFVYPAVFAFFTVFNPYCGQNRTCPQNPADLLASAGESGTGFCHDMADLRAVQTVETGHSRQFVYPCGCLFRRKPVEAYGSR